jgi:hypothetical protein
VIHFQQFWTMSTYLEAFSISCLGATTFRYYMILQLMYMYFIHYLSEHLPHATMLTKSTKSTLCCIMFTNEFTVTMNVGLFNTDSLSVSCQNATMY